MGPVGCETNLTLIWVPILGITSNTYKIYLEYGILDSVLAARVPSFIMLKTKCIGY